MVAYCSNKKQNSYSSIVLFSERVISNGKVRKTRKSSVEATDKSIQCLYKSFDYYLKSLDGFERKIRKVGKKRDLLKWAVASIRTFQPVFEQMHVNAETLALPPQADFSNNSIFECLYKLFLESPGNYLNLARLFIDDSYQGLTYQLLSRYDRREADLHRLKDRYLRTIKGANLEEGQSESVFSYDFIKSVRDQLGHYQQVREKTKVESMVSDELNMAELLMQMQKHSLN